MTDLNGKIVLGANQYGKAENRVVRIYRDSPRHEIHDINVSSALRGDFSPAHLVGDQSNVLPTDTQKQTAYTYAKSKGLLHIESYGLDLARHYVDDVEPVEGARIELEEYAWQRVVVDGAEHDHTWTRKGEEIRTSAVTVEGKGEYQKTWVVSGFKELIILKSTGSEFAGFLEDELTVLEPTHDRVMATSLTAQWRYTRTDVDWDGVHAGVKAAMIERFANLQSLALQQTLYAMGEAVLQKYPFIAEIRMSAPNKHHFLYDTTRFGVPNDNEVFNADDRPYGLIQATVEREDAPDAGSAWRTYSVVG
ncbi:factor-independent urate hydroxylase [Rhodococcoides fascians]|uniref:factor-independent urate hydroxylase n=1 Tax=Rhodococcoides fascians TaxID=1828 RepID=UPI0005608CC4|nr:urate oxidase [Rhodococcus fascians]